MDPNIHFVMVAEVVCDDIHFPKMNLAVVAGNLEVVHYKWRSPNKLVDQLAACHHHNAQNRNHSVVYDKSMTMNDDLVHHNDCNRNHDLVVDDHNVDDHTRMAVVDGIYPKKKLK